MPIYLGEGLGVEAKDSLDLVIQAGTSTTTAAVPTTTVRVAATVASATVWVAATLLAAVIAHLALITVSVIVLCTHMLAEHQEAEDKERRTHLASKSFGENGRATRQGSVFCTFRHPVHPPC